VPRKWRLGLLRHRDGTHSHVSIFWDEAAERNLTTKNRSTSLDECPQCRLWEPEFEISLGDVKLDTEEPRNAAKRVKTPF